VRCTINSQCNCWLCIGYSAGRFRNLVPGLTHWFYPAVFDPLGLKGKMLDCLSYVIDGVLMGLQQQQAEQVDWATWFGLRLRL
jgi:hypothetical protein